MMAEEKLNVSTCFLVGIDISGDDEAVAIVGEGGHGVDAKIINAFSGNEAIELYKKLITKKPKEEKKEQ